MHGDGLALPSDGIFSGETHRLPMVIEFMHDLLPTLTSFLPDVLASGAFGSIIYVIFAAAHAHADKLIVGVVVDFVNIQLMVWPVQQL